MPDLAVRPKERLRGLLRTPPPAESRGEALRLDKNEFLPCWPAEWLRQALGRLRPEHVSMHPELGPLYDKLAARLGVAREQIVLAAGSDAAIRAVFEVFVEPGDEVIFPRPTFAMYPIYARIAGARAIELDYDRELELPVERIIERIGPATKLVCLANPNSPTGTRLGRDELEALLAAAVAQRAAVLIDEAYYPFHPESVIDLVGRRENLIVTRTFSKAAGLAGLRCGALISSREIAALAYAVKPMYEVTAVSALFAEWVLDHPGHVERYAEEVREGRRLLAEALTERGFAVREGHANFLLADLGPRRAAIARGLAQAGVLFKESFDHPALERYVRFSVGPRDTMARLVRLLDGCLEPAHA